MGASILLVDILVDSGGVTGATPDLVDLNTGLIDAAGVLGTSMVLLDVLVVPGVSRVLPWGCHGCYLGLGGPHQSPQLERFRNLEIGNCKIVLCSCRFQFW